MDVSIIIVNYNTEALLTQCIGSITDKTQGIDYEIIVVDNNSAVTPRPVVDGFPGVRLVENPENIGFGRANNEGIKIAAGRNILFLNPDTVLINNAVKLLNDYLDSNPRTAIAGANLYDGDRYPNHSYEMRLPSVFTEADIFTGKLFSKMKWGKSLSFNTSPFPKTVGYVEGACMMVRSAVLDETGGFDPAFFLYYEETELTWRIRNAGYAAVNVPEASVIHFEGRSFNTNEVRERYFLEGRKVYFEKTSTPAQHKKANFWFRLLIYSRKFVYFFLNKEKYRYWKLRNEILKKIYR